MDNEQVKTDVTNIAEQELIKGEQIIAPMDDQQLAGNVAKRFPILLRQLEGVMKKAKAKDIVQGFIGALDLPKGDVSVKWIDPATRRPKPQYETTVEIFRLTQSLISGRLLISQQDWLKIIKPQLIEELNSKLEKIKSEESGNE